MESIIVSPKEFGIEEKKVNELMGNYPKSDVIQNETVCNTILLKFQAFKDWAKKEVEKI